MSKESSANKESLYTVKEAAEIINVSEQTVRRWIQSGKIKPEKEELSGTKEGYSISETELRNFCSHNAKYRAGLSLIGSTASLVAAATGPLGAIFGFGVGTVLKQKATENITQFNEQCHKIELQSEKKARQYLQAQDKKDVEDLLISNKQLLEDRIQLKQQMIEQLQQEILEYKEQISKIDDYLKEVEHENS
ncbi:DNA binding domain-containing protein, excisionase family [Lachnospiraceae bacterium XBB1006]|nr:DNA binding domain-containing protein, excisionase family [Lachnospiraceae bacterium XBB1006]